MKDQETKSLVSAAKTGDIKAFEELYKLKSRSIIFTAYGILGDYHTAEDVAQNVIVNMYRHIGKLKSVEAFDTWLYRIVINECNRALSGRVKRSESFDADDEILSIEEEDVEFLPDKYAESEANRKMVYEAVMALPKKKKQSLLMYYYNQMSYKEIADAMDITMSTVSTNILRAKQMVKERLDIMENTNNPMYSAAASMPVLTQVFNSYADKIVPDEALEEFHRTVAVKVNNAARLPESKLNMKYIVSTLVAVVVVTTGVGYLMSGHAPAAAPDSTLAASEPAAPVRITGEINFAGGEESDQINPISASLSTEYTAEISDFNNSLIWYIVQKDSGNSETALIEGRGSEAPGVFEALKDQPGVYTLAFVFTDAAGNASKLEREFTIR
jgi:RNA polymerase sigma-70 factor (ECF subfamily)